MFIENLEIISYTEKIRKNKSSLFVFVMKTWIEILNNLFIYFFLFKLTVNTQQSPRTMWELLTCSCLLVKGRIWTTDAINSHTYQDIDHGKCIYYMYLQRIQINVSRTSKHWIISYKETVQIIRNTFEILVLQVIMHISYSHI